MRKLHFSRLAETDLEDITDFIALDSVESAITFVNRLRETCANLADHPDIGIHRPRFKGGNLRSYSVGQYLIFYRKTSVGVEVSRILHGARDLDALLG